MPESLGIILAGGSATRLRPVTTVTSKQLLPVYDKPVIFYPLTTLILSGFRDIAIISTPRALPLYRELFGDGSALGITLYFIEQPEPNGLAAAFLLTEHINKGENSALILGDNLFHGAQFGKNLAKFQQINGAQIFAYAVDNPEEFGVVTFDSKGIAKSIEEKPQNSKSNWAVPGFYFYDQTVVERTKSLNPSKRGELEITDLNNLYLNDSALLVEKIPRGTAWLDLGTPDGLLDASEYVRTLQKRQGMPIGSPEEAAWRMGYVSNEEFLELIDAHPNPYYKSLLQKAVEFK
jgi:glucose-1-phosphate thymidylyltransferase